MPANLPLIYGCPSLLDRLMDHTEPLALPAPPEAGTRHYPPVQMVEDGDTVHIRANVPGLSLDDLRLTLKPGALTVRGRIPALPGRHVLQTRPAGPFRRDIHLPFPVEADGVEASIRNGILSIRLPRKTGPQKRIIPVHSGPANPAPANSKPTNVKKGASHE